MSGYDSDETVGTDSDVTLPPDQEDGNLSPDLFDDVTDTKTEKGTKKVKTPTKKNPRKIHDLSDSGSDDDIEQTRTIKQQKTPIKASNGHKKGASSFSPKSLSGNEGSPKPKKVDDRTERRKFISDFLDMAFSDPDSDNDQTTTKQDSHRSRSDNERTGKTELSKRQENYSYSNKPYKQDYSKPFSAKDMHSNGHKTSKQGSSEQSIKTKDKDRLSDISRQSPNSSLKRKHSGSPVPQELRKIQTKILNDGTSPKSAVKRSACKYGSDCYRKNPSHLEDFYHPVKKSKTSDSEDSPPPPKKQKTKAETPSTSRMGEKSRSFSSSSTPREREKSASPLTVKTTKDSVKLSSPLTVNKMFDKSSSSKSPEEIPENRIPKQKNVNNSVLPSTSNNNANKVCDKPSWSRVYVKTPKNVKEKYEQGQPYSFFLTKVHGISEEYNSSFAMDIKDILSAEMGNLTASCQFNFMFEIPWLMKQYPPEFRSKPLLIVHGEQGASKNKLQGDAMTYTNIKFCQAKLEMMYGTHHTKMMLLLYDTGMRVVIHTSNLIERDWYQKTQGMWISPVFPRLETPGKEKGESPTCFKRDLIHYITAYKAYQLKEWIEHIEKHDMSSARAVIIGSVPGRHQGDFEKSKWGHLKLRKVLKQHGPDPSIVKTWPVIGQFSSIGSMGPNKENWICGEFLESLAATKSGFGLQSNIRLQLIFPSKDNVRLSLEGFPAGGSIPYSVNTAKKQTYLHEFFHVWMSEGRGRSRAMPHIKTYIRPKQDGTMASWFLVTSANLSKAAWGALEKKGAQLMIRSYEIGVLFLPQFFDVGNVFKVTSDIEDAKSSYKFLLPYDLPAQKYEKKDRPWMWDIPYMDLPDTNGNVWCPFSK